jgi:hypothetical protein
MPNDTLAKHLFHCKLICPFLFLVVINPSAIRAILRARFLNLSLSVCGHFR